MPTSVSNKKLRPAAMNSLLFSAFSVLLFAVAAAAQSPLVLRPPEPGVQTGSLLKTNVTYQSHNQRIPWQKESPGSRRGLGVVLEGNRVLVTGQMVADATYIELELPDSGQKIPARVEAVDYEANLALLAPAANGKEAAFFAGLRPMALDTSARIGDALNVWQTGRVGELIVTPMLVSKVMNQGYVVDNASFLVYEAQGIIRSEANSFTLPVVKGGKLAGLLLRYDSKNQVATVLPGPIIAHFLKDVAQAPYDGFPSLGVEFQTTLDEQFREYLGLKPDQPGVYISKVVKGASAEQAGVREGDILLAINGERIDARGDYQDAQYGALSISHVVRGRSFVGDKVEIVVLRGGKEVVLKGKLTRKLPEDYLVLPYQFDAGPRYVLHGGLLFQELTRPYLNSFGREQLGGPLLRLARAAANPEALEADGRRRVVFLSAVLPTPATQGYERQSGQVVLAVNGVKINALEDLAAALDKPVDGIQRIELREFPHLLHLDAERAAQDNAQLMNGMFRIGSLRRL
jgi:S1-C subfamily serine protease